MLAGVAPSRPWGQGFREGPPRAPLFQCSPCTPMRERSTGWSSEPRVLWQVPYHLNGPNMKLVPGTRQGALRGDAGVIFPTPCPEAAGHSAEHWKSLSLEELTAPPHTCSATGATRRPGPPPGRRGSAQREGSSRQHRCLRDSWERSGKAPKWWDLGAESVRGTTSLPLCSHHAGSLATLHHLSARSLGVFTYNISGQLHNWQGTCSMLPKCP